MAYAEVNGFPLGLWGTTDLTTGVFTQLGANAGLVGLGEIGGTVYALGFVNGTPSNPLYNVNPANGSLTLVGPGSVSIDMFGSTTTGLYGVGNDLNLYSIDPATGADTLIGPTGLGSFPLFHGLSTDAGGNLYLFADPNMYSLNLLTGAASLIGPSASLFGPVFVGGKLYAETLPPFQINTVDPSTAANMFVSNVSELFAGMAPLPVPEPGYWPLTLVALGMIPVLRRMRV
jgi:hypothetical protein